MNKNKETLLRHDQEGYKMIIIGHLENTNQKIHVINHNLMPIKWIVMINNINWKQIKFPRIIDESLKFYGYWGKCMEVLLVKLNICLLYDAAIPLLGIYPREMKNTYPQKDLYNNVHWNISHNIPKFKTIWIYICRKISKQSVLYSCSQIKKWDYNAKWIKTHKISYYTVSHL